MVTENFECMLCDRRKILKQKGQHLGICLDCVRIIKTDWPEGKDVVVITDDGSEQEGSTQKKKK